MRTIQSAEQRKWSVYREYQTWVFMLIWAPFLSKDNMDISAFDKGRQKPISDIDVVRKCITNEG